MSADKTPTLEQIRAAIDDAIRPLTEQHRKFEAWLTNIEGTIARQYRQTSDNLDAVDVALGEEKEAREAAIDELREEQTEARETWRQSIVDTYQRHYLQLETLIKSQSKEFNQQSKEQAARVETLQTAIQTLSRVAESDRELANTRHEAQNALQRHVETTVKNMQMLQATVSGLADKVIEIREYTDDITIRQELYTSRLKTLEGEIYENPDSSRPSLRSVFTQAMGRQNRKLDELANTLDSLSHMTTAHKEKLEVIQQRHEMEDRVIREWPSKMLKFALVVMPSNPVLRVLLALLAALGLGVLGFDILQQ